MEIRRCFQSSFAFNSPRINIFLCDNVYQPTPTLEIPGVMGNCHYRLPAKTVLCATLTIIISLIVHVTTAILLRAYIFENDNTNQFPIVPRPAAMVIVNSTRYGLYDDDDWASLTPPGHGFVRHPGREEFYSVSLYHQMHCLNALRGLIADRSDLTFLRVGHANHCLNFLRQIILCDADTTLEPTTPTIVAGKNINVVTGIGVTHQCRDWAQVWKFAEDNYWEHQKSGKGGK
ncbi:hypothetical protein FPV67DRAFT_854314 [Lyophyllum atratum]|nr:hypothetical protein FPV67DRAFT_854314 [Lyophyllum atratum]